MSASENGGFSELADLVYEAAFVPEVWPQALQGLCRLSNSASGCVIILDNWEPVSFVATGPAREALDRLMANEEWRGSHSVLRIQEAPPPTFIYDADFFSPEMLEGDPMRRPILREHGFCRKLLR